MSLAHSYHHCYHKINKNCLLINKLQDQQCSGSKRLFSTDAIKPYSNGVS